MSWAWLHKFGSPKWFFYWSYAWARPLFVSGLLVLVVGLIWGLAFAPEDYQQGNSVRIIYLHVPAAMLAQSCYLALGIAGLVGLVWRIKTAAIFINAMAPIGAVMAFIALVTGAIWGKTAWGAWWVWDARLTSMLVLFLLYMGIIALQNSLEEVALADKSAAVISLVGLINLPIIKYSVVWWNTLHQGATFTLTDKPAMPASMWLPLLVAVIGFYVLVVGLVLWRMQSDILWRERRTSWVKQEVTKHGVY
ncbi:heme ABC transporter permease [Marinomonas sp. A79]|uniref:Heme exporter protein C n=1 Tax=Marinomonas vulgaris TaxID=2823372 RepID=A0ABS5HBB2_9GAMM|nr:heme ABC transporter permease [Marinomonas vulgaris]MBR7888664.1 heme ABC transporter permease [Marinomonas vulgaris]